MGVNREQSEKFGRLTAGERQKAIRNMRNGMDVDSALDDADESGKLILKIILAIVFIAGVVYGGIKLFKLIQKGFSKICPHTNITHMRSDTYERIGYFRCKLCGISIQLPAIGRTTETKLPTCYEQGYNVITYYYSKTDYTYTQTEYTAKFHHVRGEMIDPGKQPTCLEDGYGPTYECTLCHDPIEPAVIAKLDHCVYENAGRVEPTCFSTGETGIDKCIYCGDEQGTSEVIEIVNHYVLDENKTPVEPSYNKGHHNDGPCIYCEQIVSVDYSSAPLLSSLFEYEIDEENNVAKLTKLKDNTATSVVVPSSINGVPVKEVAPSLFENNSVIETIILQEGIEIVGKNAFKNCTSLKEIKVEGKETNNSLGEIFFPNSLKTIDENAFDGCTLFKRIHFNNVSEVKNQAFANCINLKIVEFSDVESYIRKEAFLNCDKIVFFKTTTHRASAETMVKNAYLYFGDLQHPNTLLTDYVGIVSSTSECVDYGRADFVNKSFEEVMKVSDDGQFYYYKQTYIGYILILIDPISTHIVIPEEIDYIYPEAFENMEGKITSVVVPESVLGIKNCKFTEQIKFYFMESNPAYVPLKRETTQANNLETVAVRFYYSETYIPYDYWHYDEDGNIVEYFNN